jgi:hypothetical protein
VGAALKGVALLEILLGFAASWLLFVLYDALRPIRDYYVLQRHYFERLYEEPWRGKLFAAHYHGFEDYFAAKAAIERHEGVMDDLQQEAEHSVFMVPARNKQAAIKSLKTGKAYRKEASPQDSDQRNCQAPQVLDKGSHSAVGARTPQIGNAP